MKRKAGEKKHWFDFLLKQSEIEGGPAKMKSSVAGALLIISLLGIFLIILSTDWRCGRNCKHDADDAPWKADDIAKKAVQK